MLGQLGCGTRILRVIHGRVARATKIKSAPRPFRSLTKAFGPYLSILGGIQPFAAGMQFFVLTQVVDP